MPPSAKAATDRESIRMQHPTKVVSFFILFPFLRESRGFRLCDSLDCVERRHNSTVSK
jgi:hypothetical protein